MSVLPVGFGSAAGGTPAGAIERSLRFNSADSAYLNRTPGSATDRQKWTWSSWVKLGSLTINQMIFSAGATSGANVYAYWNTDNTLSIRFDQEASGNVGVTAAVNRDPSAWYHVVFALDTTQATAANRVKIYINGVQQDTTGSTFPSQNFNTAMNNNVAHSIGRRGYDATSYASSLLSEIIHVDGQQLTPSSFGETDSATGVWKPKAYSGTYGTNGFELNFSDNSNTTAATLGKDSSGNGNNWTPNNFSVTAGVGNDSLVDSPTAYGTDTGVGGSVRGNYCVLNPLQKGASISASNGNLDAVGSGANAYPIIIGSLAVDSGKWYFETTVGGSGSVNLSLGIVSNLSGLTQNHLNNYFATSPNGYATFYSYDQSGDKRTGATATAYGASFTLNDVIGVAFDADAGTLTFYKNGASQGQAFTGISQYPAAPAIRIYAGYTSQIISANFGQRAFAYTAPSGFKALCTTNLPTPTIGATSTTQAGKYFDATIFTATGTTQTVTNTGFQPDWLWFKNRGAAQDHFLVTNPISLDQYLSSNTTAAEATSSTFIDTVNSNGFTMGAGNFSNGSSIVCWNWNAGGSTVTNTSGTISAQVRANTTSGFSIVTFTDPNNSSNYTVGHGLGVTPSMIIVKERGTTGSWIVWHSAATTTVNQYLLLNSTAATGTQTNIWGANVPTSTVFGLKSGGSVDLGDTVVAYCFAPVAGYSAFGSYTGNGSADGPFVYLGFRPAFVMVKRTDAVGDWFIWDDKRPAYNVINTLISPNKSDAEITYTSLDFLSNGFKLRNTGSDINASGGTIIYMAFAENPFKYSLAQ